MVKIAVSRKVMHFTRDRSENSKCEPERVQSKRSAEVVRLVSEPSFRETEKVNVIAVSKNR
jgi:hypothetical protein